MMECSSLLELLGTYSLIINQISPYLSVSSLLNLAATSKNFQNLIYSGRETFRYLDLSTTKGASVNIPPIDIGGFNLRYERIDESTTAEDFYSGPIRGIFSFLKRRNVAGSIQILILDHVSAPAEVLSEIIRKEEYQIRILSVIGSKNLNERKFQQALRYIVRHSRPEGMRKLRGVYFFGTNSRPSLENLGIPISGGVMNSPGAQLGASLNYKSHSELLSSGLNAYINPWYRNSGKVLPREVDLLDWAMTLKACQGMIYFDAILCRGPRHDPESELVKSNSSNFLGPNIASIALRGCETCHSIPEGPMNSIEAPSSHLPLLSPTPRHSSSIKFAQSPPPPPIPFNNLTTTEKQGQLLFARCAQCCADRWCEGCGKFWCEEHYDPTSSTYTYMQRVEHLEAGGSGDGGELDNINNVNISHLPQIATFPDPNTTAGTAKSHLKVHLGLCIEQCLVHELRAGSGSDGMWG